MPQTTRTPLPKFQLGVLLYLQLAEPITSTVIYPFVNEAVRNLGITGGDEKKTGYYAGLIEACFYLTEAFCILQWGRLSDKIGRRPVFIIGLFGLTLSMLGFGLSRQYWALIASRCVEGALNGNVGVAKSVMAEITDSTNMAQGFALLPAIWSVGSTIGPLIGGVLSNPAEKWPGTFTGEFWILYPYFLPCITAAGFSLSAVIMVAVALKETHPSLSSRMPSHRQKGALDSLDVELLSRRTEPRTALNTDSVEEKNASSEELASLLSQGIDSDQDISKIDVFHTQEQSGMRSPIETKEIETGLHGSNTKLPTLKSLMIPRIIISLINYAFIAFLDQCFVVLQPLMYSTSLESGGLGFDSKTIGLVLSFWGLLNVFVQGIGFPWLHDRLGTKPLHTLSIACFLVCFTAFPAMSMLARRAGGFDFWTGVVMVIQLGFYYLPCMGYSCVFIYLTDAVPDRSSLGATNGFAQTTASTMRAIAPAAASSIFALSLQYNILGGTLVYWLLNVIALGAVFASIQFPRQLKAHDK